MGKNGAFLYQICSHILRYKDTIINRTTGLPMSEAGAGGQVWHGVVAQVEPV